MNVDNRCMQEPKCDEFTNLRKEVERLRKIETCNRGLFILLGFLWFVSLCISFSLILISLS